MVQVVESLPNKCEAKFKPQYHQKKKKKERKETRWPQVSSQAMDCLDCAGALTSRMVLGRETFERE
jgi:hypothetical protein